MRPPVIATRPATTCRLGAPPLGQVPPYGRMLQSVNATFALPTVVRGSAASSMLTCPQFAIVSTPKAGSEPMTSCWQATVPVQLSNLDVEPGPHADELTSWTLSNTTAPAQERAAMPSTAPPARTKASARGSPETV